MANLKERIKRLEFEKNLAFKNLVYCVININETEQPHDLSEHFKRKVDEYNAALNEQKAQNSPAYQK